MIKMTYRFYLSAIIVFSVLTLSGCGGGDEKPATDNASGDVAADGDGKTNGNTNNIDFNNQNGMKVPSGEPSQTRIEAPTKINDFQVSIAHSGHRNINTPKKLTRALFISVAPP